MREIKVRNADILADLGNRKITFCIRTTKDSARGFALYVDNICLIDCEQVGQEAIKDTKEYHKGLFKISDIKSNGCI